MKYLTVLSASILIIIVFLFNDVAFANNIYQNNTYDFSLKLDEDWKLKSKSELKNLSPEDKDGLIESLRNIEKNSHIFIKIKKEKSQENKLYKRIKDDYPIASENERYRLTRPITTLYGLNIKTLEVRGNRVILSLSGSNHNGNILKEIMWTTLDSGELLEVEHMYTSNDLFLKKKDSLIETTFSSLKLNDSSENSSIETLTDKETTELEEKALDFLDEFDFGETLVNLLDSSDKLISIIFLVFSTLISGLFFVARG